MSRGTAVAIAFVVVGSLGTALMDRWDAFAVGFSFLFWGGLAAAITWIAGRQGADQADVLPMYKPDTELPTHYQTFNPATGLLMRGGMDDGGNTSGTTDAFDATACVDHPHSGAQGRV